METTKRQSLVLPLLFIIGLLVGCSSKSAPSSGGDGSTHPRKIAQIDPSTAATVSGVVRFDGPVPKAQSIDMTQDPSCGSKPNSTETVVVDNGNLSNVFVYVKEGLGDGGFQVPSQKVKIKQQGCRYYPHVAGAMTGQTVSFINADDTTHNIHPMPEHSRQWNESQMPKAPPIENKFERSEIMIPIKCNQHPWMKMYLNVVDSPFFAVTSSDGRFKITGLPPGNYTIAAVHEKLGEQDMKITVGPKDSKTVNFAFKNSPSTPMGQ